VRLLFGIGQYYAFGYLQGLGLRRFSPNLPRHDALCKQPLIVWIHHQRRSFKEEKLAGPFGSLGKTL